MCIRLIVVFKTIQLIAVVLENSRINGIRYRRLNFHDLYCNHIFGYGLDCIMSSS